MTDEELQKLKAERDALLRALLKIGSLIAYTSLGEANWPREKEEIRKLVSESTGKEFTP